MKVDYSTFEEDESIYEKVNIIDGDSEIKISVELEHCLIQIIRIIDLNRNIR